MTHSPGESSRWAAHARASVPLTLSLLALWSLVPVGTWLAGTSLESYRSAWHAWIWGAVVVSLFSILLMVASRGRAPDLMLALGARLGRVPVSLHLTAVAVVLGVLTIFVCLEVFFGNPHSVDGFAHLFQARILLSGHVSVAPPSPLANFATLHMVLGPDHWYSQYPLGQSVLLAIGLKLGAWWIPNPFIAAVLILAIYRVALWCGDGPSARVATALALLSPFLLATAASEMNHLAAAVFGLGAAACACTPGERHPWLPAAGAGVCLGLMTAFRPLDAVAAAIPVVAILLAQAPRRGTALLALVAAGVVATIPTLAYNAATTGSWYTFGYTALWGSAVSLGFHPVPWGIALTPARAVGLTGLDLHQLNTYALDLPIPMLALVAAGFILGRRSVTVRDTVPVLAVLALSGLLFFYWHRDVLYGPRFLFSVLPWYLILMARALVLLTRSGRAATIGMLAIVVAMLAGIVMITPTRFRAYRDGTPAFHFHPDRDARNAGITHSVVVIPDGWGTRLIARMWSMGVPARSSSRLYSAIDACSLELALDDAERTPAHRDRIFLTMDSLAALGRPGTPARVTDDRNLRLIAGETLPPPCREQITFDESHGVLAFAPFLYLNTPSLDGDIVWARDLGPDNHALFRQYADRTIYRYAPDQAGHAPVFTPILPPQ